MCGRLTFSRSPRETEHNIQVFSKLDYFNWLWHLYWWWEYSSESSHSVLVLLHRGDLHENLEEVFFSLWRFMDVRGRSKIKHELVFGIFQDREDCVSFSSGSPSNSLFTKQDTNWKLTLNFMLIRTSNAKETCPTSISLSDVGLCPQWAVLSSPLLHPATTFCYFQRPRREFDLLLRCTETKGNTCALVWDYLLQSAVHHGERLVTFSTAGRKDEDASDLRPPVTDGLLKEHCANLHGMRRKRCRG